MNIVKELDEFKTVLLLVPSIKYNKISLDIVKKLAKKKVCYITVNKSFDTLTRLFKKHKVKTKNIYFIDAISKTVIKNLTDTDNCFFVDDPAALSQLLDVISAKLKKNYDYLIFDSLTNLLIFEEEPTIAKFLLSLVNRIQKSKSNAVFYTLNIKEKAALTQEAGIFVNKVIDLGLIKEK